MSLFNPHFQIVSDLHLETPLTQPSYDKLRLDIHANYLCLLGDIGLVKDPGLCVWLRKLLSSTPSIKIFYVLGNHEPYGITLAMARERLRSFSEELRQDFGERFIFLDRSRYDLNNHITILGCTLWSHIDTNEARSAAIRLTDMQEGRGIIDWDVQSHLQEHELDLQWLNDQVDLISREEPQREILILTHHSPTVHPLANDIRHRDSDINSAFRTDLSLQPCWCSKAVKMWAFGHTHLSCFFSDANGKLIVSNQNGYASLEHDFDIDSMVIEANSPTWERIEIMQKPSRRSKFREEKEDDSAGTYAQAYSPVWRKIFSRRKRDKT